MEEGKKEEISKGLKLIAQSSVFVFMAFMFSKIFGYLYRIVIARHFGPEVYGLFSLSIVIVGWFVAISWLGFVEGILRYVSLYRGSKDLNKIRYLFRFSSRILIFSTLFFSLMLFLLSNTISNSIFHNPNLRMYLQIFSMMLPLWVFSSYFLAIMRAFEKIKEVSLIEGIMQSLLKILLLIALIYLGFKSEAIIFSFFLSIMAIFLLSFFYCRLKISEMFEPYNLDRMDRRRLAQNFVAYSWPILFLGIASSIFYWIDSFAIGYFKSATEVGLYNAVIPIVILLNIAPEMFMQLFFPMITKKYSVKDMPFIKEISKQIAKWVVLINLPLFSIILIFPDIIIKVLFGADYTIAADSLRILAVGVFVSSVILISNNLLSMIGKSKTILYDIFIASSINLALNIYLVPQKSIFGMGNSLGINGAALATSISVIVFSLLLLFQAKYYVSIIPFKKEMVKIFGACLLPLTLILISKNFVKTNILSFVILSFLLVAIYLSLLFLFKIFDSNDMMIIRSVKQKLF